MKNRLIQIFNDTNNLVTPTVQNINFFDSHKVIFVGEDYILISKNEMDFSKILANHSTSEILQGFIEYINEQKLELNNLLKERDELKAENEKLHQIAITADRESEEKINDLRRKLHELAKSKDLELSELREAVKQINLAVEQAEAFEWKGYYRGTLIELKDQNTALLSKQEQPKPIEKPRKRKYGDDFHDTL